MTATTDALIAAMDKQGIKNNLVRNGIMAIATAEGGLGEMKPELGYAHTPNTRPPPRHGIREIFGSRVAKLSDAELDALKVDDRKFFNFVYDGANSTGRQLGNRPGTDDGFNFRGRGPIQITGRANYQRYSTKAGHPEVMDNVELVNDPAIGAAMTVAYIVDRFKGTTFDQLLASVGNNTADIRARKVAAFQKFSAEHTFDFR